MGNILDPLCAYCTKKCMLIACLLILLLSDYWIQRKCKSNFCTDRPSCFQDTEKGRIWERYWAVFRFDGAESSEITHEFSSFWLKSFYGDLIAHNRRRRLNHYINIKTAGFNDITCGILRFWRALLEMIPEFQDF